MKRKIALSLFTFQLVSLFVFSQGITRLDNSQISFAEADKNVIITPDITRYRELKLRLLNGSHTMSCGLAFLAGFHYVYDAMKDESFFSFIKKTFR